MNEFSEGTLPLEESESEELTRLSVRGIRKASVEALKAKALADGKQLETWLREQIELLAAQPTVRKRYQFKAFAENGARVTLRRHIGATGVGGGASNCSQEQFEAYQKARLYVERNEPGDYEAAYKLLVQQFDEVFPG